MAFSGRALALACVTVVEGSSVWAIVATSGVLSKNVADGGRRSPEAVADNNCYLIAPA